MTADLVAAAMFLGVVAYAVFGGADYGAGVWDLLVLVDVATIEEVAGADPTLQLLLGVVVAAGVIVVPALVWLLRLVDQPRWK